MLSGAAAAPGVAPDAASTRADDRSPPSGDHVTEQDALDREAAGRYDPAAADGVGTSLRCHAVRAHGLRGFAEPSALHALHALERAQRR
jgi:hypothetical protein